MKKELEEWNQKLNDDIEEYIQSLEEEQVIYALKNYVDARFDILQNQIDSIEYKLRQNEGYNEL